MHTLIKGLGFSPMGIFLIIPFCGPIAEARNGQSGDFTEPAEIDRAVAEFTGAQIGQIGGARVAADPRLRLAQCLSPLTTSWHGRSKSTVRVECPEAGGWRIFVATKPSPAAAAPERVVKRGDPMTVIVRGNGFTVQQTGEATENGAVGDWIAIRTARRADPIRARIERPGLAVIPSN